MKTEGGLFEEGQSPEINRGLFNTYAVGVAEGREVQERSACDMMRLGLKEGERKKKTGRASDGTAGLVSPGEHRGKRGGASLLCRGQRRENVSVLIFMCL